jgi:hypothetical protein
MIKSSTKLKAFESLQKKAYRGVNAAIKAVYETVTGDLRPPGRLATIAKRQ